MRRPLFLCAPLLAALTISCSRGGAEQQDAAATATAPVAVRVIPAATADVPLEIAAIGNVEAVSTVDVKARITAPALKGLFNEGHDVTQGQPLCELDPETI